MKTYEYSSQDILKWRREQLILGGTKYELDYLLDAGAGLNRCDMQKIYLGTLSSFCLTTSLLNLSILWVKYLDENIPLQYLTGVCFWRDFQLKVDSNVMIPRKETELLVDFAIDRFKDIPKGRWADLGTGSGVLAISLAINFPLWQGHVVDISHEALRLAESNLQNLARNAQYTLHIGDWWKPLKPWWGSLNLVLANPPYIPDDFIKSLDPLVLNNEPHLALFAGKNGLDACKEIIDGAHDALAPGGCLMLEHHYDQSDAILELMIKVGLVNLTVEKDLEGIKRFVIAFKAQRK